MSEPTYFDQLLHVASREPQPQRLLFVFAASELPADASPAQRRRFEEGAGGALEPLACVDKGLGELTCFDALVAESRLACPPWQVVFIAGLGGADGREPSAQRVEAALQAMVDGVRSGSLNGFLALDAAGDPVRFLEAA